MIVCNKCLIAKPRSEFFSRAGGKHRTPCKGCVALRKKVYESNKAASIRAVNKTYRTLQRRYLLTWVRDIKTSNGCVDCGYSSHPAALQFDHVLGEKRGCVSTMVHNGFSKAVILEEISKCQIRCVVCHRIRTHGNGTSNPTKLRMALRVEKSRPCEDCGREYPPCAMDFDHVDPETKTACVGQMAGGTISISTLMSEIRKCRLLCANCHAIKTHPDEIKEAA